MSKFRFKLCVGLLTIYLLLAHIILPLLSPLRATGVIDPGELRNLILPPLFVALLLAVGIQNIVKARSLLHLAIGLAFFQAAIIGAPNLLSENGERSYLSHLFQLASAYVMLGVGWNLFEKLSFDYWRRIVTFSLVAILASSVITLGALGRGDIGRLYTPAYGFVLISAYSVLYSHAYSFLTLAGIFISNKRGPIVSVFAIIAIAIYNHFLTRGNKNVVTLFTAIVKVSILFISIGISAFLTITWASLPENSVTPVGRAINITTNRMQEILIASDTSRSLDEISAGRLEEINYALNSLSGLDYLLGSGAGWSVTLDDGKLIQNIHFSPLSILSVFGLPFATFIYLHLFYLAYSGMRRNNRLKNTVPAERMAPFYLFGALIHSLFAYSLFIDWLVFLFAGALLKSRNKWRTPL